MDSSKEKVNPGETCPFCGTVTNPGSTVCRGCGAERVLRSSVSTAKICLWFAGGVAMFMAPMYVAYIVRAREILPFMIPVAAYIVFMLLRLRSQREYYWVRYSKH